MYSSGTVSGVGWGGVPRSHGVSGIGSSLQPTVSISGVWCLGGGCPMPPPLVRLLTDLAPSFLLFHKQSALTELAAKRFRDCMLDFKT